MRSLSCILMLWIFSCLDLSAQDRELELTLTKVYEHVQSFRFHSADSILKELSAQHKISQANADPLTELGFANYQWWLIVSGEDTPLNRDKFVKASDASLSKLKDASPSALTNEQLYIVITGYANKARVEGLNKNYLKGFVHINTCLKYIQRSFGREEDFKYFTLTTGLYNYYMATANKNFPVLLPYLALFPDGDLEKGKKMLTIASNSENKLLSTEGHYFLFKLYNDEKLYQSAGIHLSRLLKQYPGNLLYTYYKFKMLLDQGKKDEALEVMSEIRLKEMMNTQLTDKQKKYFSGLATKDLKEFYLKKK